MRAFALLLLLALVATPAAAAEERKDSITIPSELTDPAMAETLSKMLSSLTKAMLDVPIGEVQAAAQGRTATPADKARTIRDMAGHDHDLERRVEQQVRQAMPRMQATMKAMAASLPAMARSVENVAEEMEGGIDRATANLPTPGYPKR